MVHAQIYVNGEVIPVGVPEMQVEFDKVIPDNKRYLIDLTNGLLASTPYPQDVIVDIPDLDISKMINEGPDGTVEYNNETLAKRYYNENDVFALVDSLYNSIATKAEELRNDSNTCAISVVSQGDLLMPTMFLLDRLANIGVSVLFPIYETESLPSEEDYAESVAKGQPIEVCHKVEADGMSFCNPLYIDGRVRYFVNLTNTDYTVKDIYRRVDMSKERKPYKKVIYVAVPYSADPAKGREYSKLGSSLVKRLGGIPYSPVFNFEPVYDNAEYDEILRVCVEMLYRCDEAIFITDHGDLSKGQQIEFDECQKIGKPTQIKRLDIIKKGD